jgi:hypothetical protein
MAPLPHGFNHDAHPMAIMVGVVAGLALFTSRYSALKTPVGYSH